ncbi:MAG: mechanosensitive ion channel [Nocardioides sp.]|uniref:mechanosensitive ion channel family protein n=1 Tax=Nocardioides sp. TaxID=35761 RepID=UPI0023A17B31|nr:mechanosensitive ion channel [Nocardioides sp.]MDE0775774.1 mechanosensitive ion channel [Nocardioides sp.]
MLSTTSVQTLTASVTDEISDSAGDMLDALLRALPRVGVAIVLVAVGWAAAKAVRWALHRWLARGHAPSFATVMSKIAGWFVVTLAVLAAVTVVFPSVQPVDLLAGLGFFSLAIGFAFKDILENTLSGVLMLFRQPFASGDQIEVQGYTGTVQAITIRETRLRTFDGQLVLIPNSDVYTSAIRVQTHHEQRRMSFVVGVAYENDPAEASAVIVRALGTVDGVATEPGPQALITTLGVSTVDLDARFWCDSHQRESLLVLHRAIDAVKRALDEAGIEMPADIVALQATPSFRAALQGDAAVTPGGSVRPA